MRGSLSSNCMKPAAVKNHAPMKKLVLAPVVPSHLPNPGAEPRANSEDPMMNVHDCMRRVGRNTSGAVADSLSVVVATSSWEPELMEISVGRGARWAE